MKKKQEQWVKKAIEYLEKSEDEEIRKAIIVLKEGKGFLTSYAPVMIKFFSDLS